MPKDFSPKKTNRSAGQASGPDGAGGPPVSPDWWQTLFDEVYLRTDARSVQDSAVTRREVDQLVEHLGLEPGEVILDLCGGHGRHCLELGRRGFAALTVLDYAAPLLAVGREQAHRENLAISFIQGDARRLPLAAGSFQTVLILANSFGYCQEEEEDRHILAECRRVIGPGGRLFLELPEPAYLRQHLKPQSWHEADGDLVVCRERWLSETALKCRELVMSRSRGLVRDRTYQVRLYDADAITHCLRQAGFSQVRVQGGFSPYVRPGDYGSMSQRLRVTAWK